MPATAFLLPGPLDTPTGGFVYDRHVVAGLRAAGAPPDLLTVEGGYPAADAGMVARAAELLAGVPDGAALIADGLCLTPLIAAVRPHAGRLQVIALVHHPLGDETGLSETERQSWLDREAAALAHCRRVVTTSRTTAERVHQALSVPHERIAVIPPGVGPALDLGFRSADPAPSRRLLTVGTLIRRKGHDIALRALAGLKDRNWHLDIVGEARDPHHAAELRALIADLGLDDRVTLRGALSQSELDDAYREADLFLLASRHEGFGIAYQEAIRWGLPVVGTAAGAIPEAVPDGAGILVAPEDPGALRQALADLLDDGDRFAALCRGACEAAAGLTRWETVGARFAALISEMVGTG